MYIDNIHVDEVVCPYCGYKFYDSWEFGDGSDEDLGLIECCECDKKFYGCRTVETTYSTYKARYGECKNCKTEDTVLEDYNSSIGKYTDLCVECGDKEKDKFRKEYFDRIR